MTTDMSIDTFASVLNATSEPDLMSRLKSASGNLGFDRFRLGIEIRRPLIDSIRHVSIGEAPSWQAVYGDDGFIPLDPALPYWQRFSEPMIWCDEPCSADRPGLWEEPQRHGTAYGLSVPVPEHGGVKSLFSVARDTPIDDDRKERGDIVAGACLLANCAHVAASKILVPALLKNRAPRLTKRELECLNWAARGKTSWEIGTLMGISEAAAVFHLKNVIRKLDVSNRTQAIALGVSLGLVE